MSKQIKISDQVFESLKKNKKKLSFTEYFERLLFKQEPQKVQLVKNLRNFFYENRDILKPVYKSDDGFVNAILKDISLYEDGIDNDYKDFKLKIVEKK